MSGANQGGRQHPHPVKADLDGRSPYWELALIDPLDTKPAKHVPLVASLEYNWIQARLFRIDCLGRQEIHKLRLQEHNLIRYMN